MKPIILVILGSAMLMPMIHQQNNTAGNSNAQPEVQQTKGLPQDAIKKDSEATIHAVDFMMERMQ